jgi:holliday junction DNA helicase RuvB
MADCAVSNLHKPDVALEMMLRLPLFSKFTGQPKVKERLENAVTAAKKRKEPLNHLSLNGPPGSGKASQHLRENSHVTRIGLILTCNQ